MAWAVCCSTVAVQARNCRARSVSRTRAYLVVPERIIVAEPKVNGAPPTVASPFLLCATNMVPFFTRTDWTRPVALPAPSDNQMWRCYHGRQVFHHTGRRDHSRTAAGAHAVQHDQVRLALGDHPDLPGIRVDHGQSAQDRGPQ